MNENKNILGTEPIPRLMLKFGLPSVVSMLVNSIYNIVDQIFIGQRVGYLGNAATNVTFPFVMISLAIALMISVGTAANVGLSLGRGDQKSADHVLGNGFTMAIIAGILLLVFGEVFLSPMLRLFGATDKIMEYAVPYASIYIIGMPFITIGIMVNDEIRADGSPAFAMRSMLAGAVFNIVFDYIFMFPLNMGVRGAALATILGQALTMVISLSHIGKLKTIHLKKENLMPVPHIMNRILTLGFSSFINQCAMLIMQIVLNRQAVKYGALSKYGPEIPLTAYGIVMKVNQIMTSIILGLCTGSQPIYSFNYGAGKYHRVRQLTLTSIGVGTIIGIIGTCCFQLFPHQIMSIFGNGEELYQEFCVIAIRTMTILIFILGLQMTASIYFQATGRSKGAMIIALSRQILFMIPLLLIVPRFLGLIGVGLCFPLADVCAFTLCAVMLTKEMKELRLKMNKEDAAHA